MVMTQLMNQWRTGLVVLVVTVLCGSIATVWVTSAGAVKSEQDVAMYINPACVISAVEEWGFTDVATGSTHADAINCLAYYGISIGTGDGSTFSPGANVKRWQMALFMQRIADVTGVILEEPDDQGLADIAMKEQPIQDAINQVIAAGIMTGSGVTDTRSIAQTGTGMQTQTGSSMQKRWLFVPDANVSRADMAVIIIRWLEKASDQVKYDDATDNYEIYKPDSATAFVPDDRFEDAATTVNSEQYNAILALYELGVVNGTSSDVFSPRQGRQARSDGFFHHTSFGLHRRPA